VNGVTLNTLQQDIHRSAVDKLIFEVSENESGECKFTPDSQTIIEYLKEKMKCK